MVRIIYRRTWDFPAETLTCSYNECGVSPSSGAPIFSRVLFPNTIVLSPGQQMRLTYEMTTSWSPCTASYGTASISGWPVGPSTNTYFTQSIQNWMISEVRSSDGITFGWEGYYTSLEPAIGGRDYGNHDTNGWTIFGSEDSMSLSGFDAASTRGTNVSTDNSYGPDAYVAGTFTRTKTGTFSIYELNTSNIRSIGFGSYVATPSIVAQPYWAGSKAYCMLFSQPQTKLNTQTLTMTWRWNWARVLPTSSVLSYSVMPPPSLIECGGPSTYYGGRNMPTSYDVDLGSATGPVSVSYNVYENPDRVQIWFDGTIRYDTGYLGLIDKNLGDNFFRICVIQD